MNSRLSKIVTGLAIALLLAWAVAYRFNVREEPRAAEQTDTAEPSLVLVGKTIKVTDGDTIRVQLDTGPIKVRVFGADAPERDAPFGAPATKLMRSLVEGKDVELEPVTQDSYDRMVARVFVDGTDVGAAMIEKGYAWAYRNYLGQIEGAERYCDLEAAARADRRGVWADPPSEWQPPWVDRGRARPRDYSTETAADCRAAIRRGQSKAGPEAPPKLAPPDPACRIKGNINSKGERIYHVPGSPNYDDTEIDERRGERWFRTEEEARAAGWRAPRG